MSDETETHHPAVQLVRADGPADVIAATAAAERAENEHRAPDIKNIFLGGLFLLALLAACYVAAEIVLPIVVAFVLMLVLQPAMRLLQRLHLPRGIAALLMILVLFAALAV